MAEPTGRSISGLGIDLEEIDALRRFDACSHHRFLARWLTPEEQAWCRAQPDLASALVITLCCREAVLKALHRPTLAGSSVAALLGDVDQVRRASVLDDGDEVEVSLGWTLFGRRALAVAVAVKRSGEVPGLRKGFSRSATS